MNTDKIIIQAKSAVGIDARYDVQPITLLEVEKAKTIFLAAYASYLGSDGISRDGAIQNALAEVWHAAKQYQAQHPEHLYETI